MKGILGQKAGMTQIFTQDGILIPVTVVHVKTNVVTQVKTGITDGYMALQLAIDNQKPQRVSQGEKGHFKKAKTGPKRFTREIRGMSGFELGANIKGSDIFSPGEYVDVTGISKGKGFSGTIKRYNAKIGPKAHGSGYHRGIGSMGDIEGNKVSKGKIMPGQHGHKQRTIQNLEVMFIDDLKEYILVKGSIPGPNKSYVLMQQAVKKPYAKNEIKLINVREMEIKNKLIEEATHLGALVNADMAISDLEKIIIDTKAVRTAEAIAKEAEKVAIKESTETVDATVEARKAMLAAEKIIVDAPDQGKALEKVEAIADKAKKEKSEINKVKVDAKAAHAKEVQEKQETTAKSKKAQT